VDKPYWLNERQFSAEQRRQLAKKGQAMSDGSFPIVTKADLSNAVQAYGRSANKAAAKAHITKRARALGAVSMLPKSWGVKEASVETILPLSNREFRTELGRALLADTAFARDMTVAAAKALSGDPLQEAARSHDQTRQAVAQALRDKYRQGDDDFGPWIREMYDDRVVFEQDGDTWQSTYTIDDEESVTLGDRVEVEIRYVPVVVTTESGDGDPQGIPLEDLDILREAFVPLVEKALRRDDTVAVKLIAPGRGSSGYYSADVLERDASAAFPKGTKMYWDHPTESESRERPERSLRDLAAELVSEARFDEEGASGPGVYADAKVFGEYKTSVEELAPHIGVSINAGGVVNETATAEDGTAGIVERIVHTPFNSVDFVTEPGAGGSVQQLFESARGRGRSPAPRKEPEMAEKDLQEANRKLTEADTQLQEARQKTEAAEKERDEAVQERDRLREAGVIREAREAAHAVFDKLKEEATFDLPQMTRDRLAERLSKNPPTKDGALDKDAFDKQVAEAVKDEAKYLAEVTGSGRVTGLGPSDSGADPEKVTERMTSAFEQIGLTESGAKVAAQGRS
jgi:hypothetical protein